MLVYAIISPFAGSLVYKKGIKNMMILWAILTSFLIYPAFYLLNIDSLFTIFIALVMLAILSSFFQACVNIFLVHLFCVEVRYRGVALSYTLGLAIFGGTVTPILLYYKENNLELMMGAHIIIISCLAILAIYFSKLKLEIYSYNDSLKE